MKEYQHKIKKSHGNGEFSLSEFRKIGENVVFEKGVMVFHPENIEIGNNVYIGHNAMLKGYYKNIMRIGDNTWIGQGSFFRSGGGLYIGNNVGVGPFIKILTHQHIEEEPEKPILLCGQIFEEVIIEDNCDIGIGSIILPGVRIGKGSIVGAGTVVTSDVEPFTLVVGNPSRFLRKRKGA